MQRCFRLFAKFCNGLQHGCIEQLAPQFPKQDAGAVGVGGVDLAVDHEGIADHVGLFLDDLFQHRTVIFLSLLQVLVLDGQLIARRRGRCAERLVEARAEVILRLGDFLPHLALVLAELRGHAELFAGKVGFRAGERTHVLTGAPVPAPALHAERWDGNAPGFCREDKIHAERAVLPPAFHHVAGLNVEIEKLGEVFDFELPDIAGFVDGDALLLQRFVERDEAPAVERVRAEQQKDAEIFVSVGAGDGDVV